MILRQIVYEILAEYYRNFPYGNKTMEDDFFYYWDLKIYIPSYLRKGE